MHDAIVGTGTCPSIKHVSGGCTEHIDAEDLSQHADMTGSSGVGPIIGVGGAVPKNVGMGVGGDGGNVGDGGCVGELGGEDGGGVNTILVHSSSQLTPAFARPKS